jgi:1,2-beta-oligoglucan phosphorylase
MSEASTDFMTTPRDAELRLRKIVNKSGIAISLLPNGALFSIEHARGGGRVMVNQLLAAPIADGMGSLNLRIGGARPEILPIVGAGARCQVGVADDRAVWKGEQRDLRHSVTLWLHPSLDLWLWRVEIENLGKEEIPCDTIFVQDLGLGAPGFVMNNEAYASQYIDHFIAGHPRIGFITMSRQNLSQGGAHPWIAHGCFEGAAAFGTDFRQFMGPAHRDAERLFLPFGASLPSKRLQYETACAALQSRSSTLTPGAAAGWTFFAYYLPDHPRASSDADLQIVDVVEKASADWAKRAVALFSPAHSLLHDAPAAVADDFDEEAIATRYPTRTHLERIDGRLLSFFVPGETYSRHVVLREKDRLVARRHGALLLTGEDILPTEATLCATCWMHGVFGAQLAIGNTSFHKLFSVSRDPYNITRGSGLRVLAEFEDGWRLLAVPSAFEMGLSDCRWIYCFGRRLVTIHATVSADEPAMRWHVTVEGGACRFLIFGQLVLGDAEFAHAGEVELDKAKQRFTFRPDPSGMWRNKYPGAVYHLVASTPQFIEAAGGDELLYPDGQRRSGGYVAIRTCSTNAFTFAVVGSLTDEQRAELLAVKYAREFDDAVMEEGANRYWRSLTRGIHIDGVGKDAEAESIDTILPWLSHDAMVHLRAPHGLEQYSGAAWGTRDVCQGPVELLLSLEHDEAVKTILRILFAEQQEEEGDWPQWFMLEPYSSIRDKEAHGDVIVWPLKALCDYIEATGDFAFLSDRVTWRRACTFERTSDEDSICAHVQKLISTVRSRFVPGTHLIRYGNGDWNDSLQPVDPERRDWMASSWTVALLYEQLRRYAKILARTGRRSEAEELDLLAVSMREDFNRFLIHDGTLAGYAVFQPQGGAPLPLIHPSDKVTGVSYSMFAFVQAIVGGVFTEAQAQNHLGLIRKHLLFPDGARLMERPLPYHGGPETVFRRAESAAFFGREIGLMYTHSHLRYAEAMSKLGEPEALWDALIVANPISATDRLPNASLRQRNAYFSSSDAAFNDRYQADAEWPRVKSGTIAVDGGWRIYSSGPGLYVNMVVRHAFGTRREFGQRIADACLPASKRGLSLLA